MKFSDYATAARRWKKVESPAPSPVGRRVVRPSAPRTMGGIVRRDTARGTRQVSR